MLRDLQSLGWTRRIGSKARYLRRLQRQGYRVPRTYVIPWDVHDAWLARGAEVLDQLGEELRSKLDAGARYAVRSCASVEDLPGHSFAGQFMTCLDVTGTAGLLQAIRRVWDSASSDSAVAYAQTKGLSKTDVKMAVLVQAMVSPAVSGVVFSKNPVTGMDETIVEAVRGSGAALVQDGAMPARWVWKWGTWIEQPTHTDIDESLVEDVVGGARSIASKLKGPVDLEWVYDGRSLHWIQARPITALPERNVYSNRIAREFLPGIILPLVWSVNIPLVNGAWIRLLSECIGPNDLDPNKLAKAFHYRAYFNMGSMGQVFTSLGLRRETLEVLMGLDGGEDRPSFKPSVKVLRHLPRMARCVLGKLVFSRRIEALLPKLRDEFRRWPARPLSQWDEAQLLDETTRLFGVCQEAAYANIVTPLLMQIYNGIFERQLKALKVAPDEVDLTHGLDALHEFDPKSALAEMHAQYAQFDRETQERIRKSSYEDFLKMPGLQPFQEAVVRFVGHFGHMSDSGNDFSRVPWNEQPQLVLQMIAGFDRAGTGTAKRTWDSLPLRAAQRLRIGPFFRRARQYRFYREAVGFYYTLGYGLFRRLFLELGSRFAGRGLLDDSRDVFYLYWDEVRRIAGSDSAPVDARARIRDRKEEIEAVRDRVLPDVIFGERPPPSEHADSAAHELKGIPTSSGYYQGPACVFEAIADSVHLKPGDVAVIPYSDVSWTPVLVQAGAIVAESGGTLCHTSIVARECGIPAVVSVNGACRRVRTGMTVAVNGFTGDIALLDSDEPP